MTLTPDKIASPIRGREPLDRLGAICGIAYVVLALAGNGLAGETDRATDPGIFLLGTILEFLGFAAFICFVSFLVERLRRGDRSWLPTAVLVAAGTNVAVKLATSAPWLVNASLRPGEVEPALGQVLDDIGQVGFALTFFTFGLMVSAAAVSALRSGVAAPWVARVGIGLGAIGAASVTLPLDSEVAAVPLVLSMFWLIAFSASILRRMGDHAQTAAGEQ